MNADLRNKLIWNAVPSLFDVPNPPRQVAPKRRRLLRSITGTLAKKPVRAQTVSVSSGRNDGRLIDHSYCGKHQKFLHISLIMQLLHILQHLSI
jgi:hypothetical protein